MNGLLLRHAGSRAAGQPGRLDHAIHPAAIGALSCASIAIPLGPPKSWDVLVRSGAPIVDFVITLDDEVASFAPGGSVNRR